MTTEVQETQFDKAQYERQGHEIQCAGVPLGTKLHRGVRWFRCDGCGFVFNEFTEGAANLVRRSGVPR